MAYGRVVAADRVTEPEQSTTAERPASVQPAVTAPTASGELLLLQRRIGNRATQRLLGRAVGAVEVGANPPVMTADVAPGPTHTEYTRVPGQAFVTGTGDVGDIDANDVRQGQLGDCWFLSTLAAVALANPAAVRRLISPAGEGRYNVSLYSERRRETWWGMGADEVTYQLGAATVDDRFPTVAGAPRYAAPSGDTTSGGGSELWVMLLEKAWAIRAGGYQAMHSAMFPTRTEEAMKATTGQGASSWALTGSETDAAFAQRLSALLTARHAVTASIGQLPAAQQAAAQAASVVQGHAYAVKAVNTGAATIDLHNPWGFQHVNGLSIAGFRQMFAGCTQSAGPVT
jgi:hypothetical protein